MASKISGRVSIFFENKNVDATVVLMDIEDSEQIKSGSWSEVTEAIALEDDTKGQVQFAKAWNDKPAKMIQWFKEDENIRFDIWYQAKDSEWAFNHEYTISVDEMKAFEPVHNYNLQVMNSLKKDFVNDALDGTTFLTRES